MLPLNNELESCWCQKLTVPIKIILHPKFERKRMYRRYFMTLWFFNKSNIICIDRDVGRHTLAPSNMAAKATFCLYLVKRLIGYAQMCWKRYHIIFSTISLNLKCKISFQKEVIHSFKIHILVMWPATNILVLRKWCGFDKPNHYYFV